MHDPLTPPPPGRNPDAAFVALLLTVSGIGLLLTGAEPGSVNDLVPQWMATTWALVLTGGAAVLLAGVMWRRRVTGLLIEVVGRVMLAPASLAYAVAVVASAGATGGTVVGLLVALALSSIWRLFQIRAELARLRRTIAALGE